jgi:hypothetical protein
VADQRIQEQYQNSNSFSNSSGNQSNRQQRRQHHQSSQSNQQNFQRQQQQHSRPPFQQQQQQHIEDEYRPQNVDFMDTNQVLEADASFFEGYQNDQLLQSVMRGDEFEPFQNASQNNPAAWNPAAWNQGGDVPFSSPGINFNQSGGNAYINQRDSRTLGGIVHGGSINEFNDGSRRTSAGRAGAGWASREGSASGGRTSASGGRTSASVGGRARGGSGGRTSGNA